MNNKIIQIAAAEGGQAAATTSPKAPIYVPQWKVDGSGYVAGWGTAAISREEFYREVLSREKLILLNAVVAPLGPMFMFYEPVDVETAVEVLRRGAKIESFIGHESTAKLLSELSGRNIPFNRAIYIPQRGDITLIVRLRGGSRTVGTVGAADVLTPDMLEFALLWYL